ncbi:MAG: glutaredoxin family protein [Gammaproteobacteria bacterium]|nr:glutaredoxin family protein [Gammaproteobacteria bacterium]
MATYRFYTKAGCGLCEEMLEEVLALGVPESELEFVDIEQRPELAALYGVKIPVIERGGVELAAGRLNDQSRAALRQ